MQILYHFLHGRSELVHTFAILLHFLPQILLHLVFVRDIYLGRPSALIMEHFLVASADSLGIHRGHRQLWKIGQLNTVWVLLFVHFLRNERLVLLALVGDLADAREDVVAFEVVGFPEIPQFLLMSVHVRHLIVYFPRICIW